MGVVRTDPQPEQDNRADRPLTGPGWVVACPTCGKSRVVTRAEIVSGDWVRCPHCAGGDGKEAA